MTQIICYDSTIKKNTLTTYYISKFGIVKSKSKDPGKKYHTVYQ